MKPTPMQFVPYSEARTEAHLTKNEVSHLSFAVYFLPSILVSSTFRFLYSIVPFLFSVFRSNVFVITNKTGSTTLKKWTTPDSRNTPSTTNLEEEETVDAPRNDGNGSMPEQVKRPNPWRKMMMMMMYLLFLHIFFTCPFLFCPVSPS